MVFLWLNAPLHGAAEGPLRGENKIVHWKSDFTLYFVSQGVELGAFSQYACGGVDPCQKSLEDEAFCGAGPREGGTDFQDPFVDGFVNFGTVHVYPVGVILGFDVHFADQGGLNPVMSGCELP